MVTEEIALCSLYLFPRTALPQPCLTALPQPCLIAPRTKAQKPAQPAGCARGAGRAQFSVFADALLPVVETPPRGLRPLAA